MSHISGNEIEVIYTAGQKELIKTKLKWHFGSVVRAILRLASQT